MNFRSITKSSYLKEGLEALRIAQKVNTVEELMGKYTINQNSDYSRKTCWGEVKKRYFEIADKKIIKTPLLKMIDILDDKLNKEIMYYSYLHKETIAREAVLKYIYPRLISEGCWTFERKNMILFLKDYISEYSDATITKTANSIYKALKDFGIAKIENKESYFTYYDASLYSFLYGLYAEYSPGYKPANRFNILNPSVKHIQQKAHFYKLFLIKPSHLRTYLNLGWELGYLDYEPRAGLDQYVLKHKSLDGLVDKILKEVHYE